MGSCLSLRFDGSGGRLAVMCEREVLLLDLATRLETAKVSNPHREDLTAFDLAASGTRLLTAGHEGEVAVWDAVTLAPIRRFSVSGSRRPGPRPPPGVPLPEVWWLPPETGAACGSSTCRARRRGSSRREGRRTTSRSGGLRGCAAPERKRSDAQALEVASGCKTSIA